MLPKNREIWLALLAIMLISLLYIGMVYHFGSVPAARGFFGHSLGVIGFIMMLMTEILYSLRKRSRSARWGRMANWLQFHIFTGLVGPFLVLLHTSWKFNGLAGLVFLLTVLIVISGIMGRYIYTAVPRTADGTELQAREIGAQIRLLEEQIAQWRDENPHAAQAYQQRTPALRASVQTGPALVIGRVLDDLAGWLAHWRTQQAVERQLRPHIRQMATLVQQQRQLKRQMESIASARRLLAVWHTIHIPVGMVLFTLAFIHIAASIYYATLLH